MGKPTITILDQIHCRANPVARDLIKRALKYEVIKPKRSQFGHKKKRVKQYLITGREGSSGMFLTGLLPRVKKYCRKKGIDIKIRGNLEKLESNWPPELKGITFRDDQLRMFKKARRRQRGNFIAPTGSGKTIIQMGLMNMFIGENILWLCHTQDLLFQTKEELTKRGISSLMHWGGEKVDLINIRDKEWPVIILGTVQSFVKIPFEQYADLIDVIMIDEVHHVNAMSSQYAYILMHCIAPRRYGFTATVVNKPKEILINEGLFGQTIAELPIEEAIEKGIIAKPIVNLVPVPYNTSISTKYHKFKDLYEYGIVKNKERHKLIIEEAINESGTTLIIIEREEHGLNIQKSFKKYQKMNIPFVYGPTKRKERDRVKDDLEKGKERIVICSRIWREGINIRTLNHVINAMGWKDEKIVEQIRGRGGRTTEAKSTMKLTDFLDPYKYLAEHTVHRLHVYAKHKWI